MKSGFAPIVARQRKKEFNKFFNFFIIFNGLVYFIVFYNCCYCTSLVQLLFFLFPN